MPRRVPSALADPPSYRLLVDGVAVAPARFAVTRAARRRGLLGYTHLDGVLVFDRTRQVHTVGMRMPIDVAWCAADGGVLRVATMVPGRVSAWIRDSCRVIETEAGRFAHWRLVTGSRLDVVPVTDVFGPAGRSSPGPSGEDRRGPAALGHT